MLPTECSLSYHDLLRSLQIKALALVLQSNCLQALIQWQVCYLGGNYFREQHCRRHSGTVGLDNPTLFGLLDRGSQVKA